MNRWIAGLCACLLLAGACAGAQAETAFTDALGRRVTLEAPPARVAALLGASFVTLCDTLARCLFAPYELPVGIFMSFFGAPFFLYILFKGKGGHGRA